MIESRSRAGSIIQQSVHETEPRSIASRCPKLRTSKGHLVYKRPPARSQLRSRKLIDMHVIIIHASHMSSMNNRYHHITLQSTSLLTYIWSIQRSHVCDQHYIIQRKQIRSEYRQV